MLRAFFVYAIFVLISAMIPITQTSTSTAGVSSFVNTVSFTHLDGQTGDIKSVTTLDDVVLYSRALVSALFPTENYGGQPREVPYLLRVHRLMNAVVLSQRRVSATNCAYRNMEEYYPDCYKSLDDGEVRKSFQGHEYDDNLGGVYVELPLNRTTALDLFTGLEASRFWDLGTREASIRFAFFNAPGLFSGYTTVKFGLSPYGDVDHDVDIRFLRLQPYSREADGERLITVQVCAGSLVIVIFAEMIYHASKQPHRRYSLAYLLRPWAFVDYATLVLIFCSLQCWKLYITGPYRAGFDPAAPQFDQIAGLAKEFGAAKYFLSLLLLVITVRIAEYMVLVNELSATYVSISKALSDIGWFCVLFFLLFGGFLMSGHVLFGSDVTMFRDLETTGMYMMLWLLALGGGHEQLFEQPGGLLFLALFFFVCLILLFNILMALVLMAFDPEDLAEIKTHVFCPEDRPGNHIVADAICDFFNVPDFKQDLYRGHHWNADDDDDDDSGSEAPLLGDVEKGKIMEERRQRSSSDPLTGGEAPETGEGHDKPREKTPRAVEFKDP
jgi:hypothetical protein